MIGFLAGLRSLTPPAATSWAAYLGWLKLERPLSLLGSFPAVVVLSILAIIELIVDKLPIAPNRTEALGLIARVVTGGLTGACISTSGGQSTLAGAGLGAVGGIVGCFSGFQIRTRLVKALAVRDVYVALVEDFICIIGCLLIVSRA